MIAIYSYKNYIMIGHILRVIIQLTAHVTSNHLYMSMSSLTIYTLNCLENMNTCLHNSFRLRWKSWLNYFPLEDNPTDMWHHNYNNVIITSKQRRGVVLMWLWRCHSVICPFGTLIEFFYTYYGCWWFGNTRSSAISSHAITVTSN